MFVDVLGGVLQSLRAMVDEFGEEGVNVCCCAGLWGNCEEEHSAK